MHVIEQLAGWTERMAMRPRGAQRSVGVFSLFGLLVVSDRSRSTLAAFHESSHEPAPSDMSYSEELAIVEAQYEMSLRAGSGLTGASGLVEVPVRPSESKRTSLRPVEPAKAMTKVGVRA